MTNAYSSAPRNCILVIKPPKILSLMPQAERAHSVMLLGIEAEANQDDSLRLRLNIVFQAISIRRGHIGRADYYVATTGGSVVLGAPDATLVHYTGPESVEIEYAVGTGEDTANSIKLAPEVKGKIDDTNVSVQLGSLEHGRKSHRTSTTKFTSSEMLLVAIDLGDAVRWQIDSHRGEKAFRDFIAGNVFLEAIFRWKGGPKSGSVQICPSDISFFDSARRLLSRRASILMLYSLWRKGIRVENRDGIRVTFAQSINEPTE